MGTGASTERGLSNRAAYLLLILATSMWGSYFPLTKLALYEIPPLTFIGLRFALAAPVLWVILLRTRRRLRPGRGDLLPFLFLGMSGYVFGTALTYVGVDRTTAINASLIQATAPVVVAVGSAVFLRESLRPINWAGVFLSTFGVLFIVSGGVPGRLLHGAIHTGDLILILSQVGWAAYTIYGRTMLRRYSPAVATTYAYAVGALLLVPVSLLEAPLAPLRGASAVTWAIILFQALLGGVTHIWYYAGIRAVGASRSIVFMNLSPLVGVLLARLLLGEILRAAQIVGGVIVLVGVFLTTRQ